MDYKALIDFNKFTLALAAGGLVYVLERFTPTQSTLMFVVVLSILCLFLISVLAGIILFAAATSNLHTEKKPADGNIEKGVEGLIQWLGITHIVCLGIGMALLGGVIVTDTVRTKMDSELLPECCCESCCRTEQ